MTVTDKQKDLPTMRWPPKMRKTPIGYRLIVASKQCCIKPLNKIISNIFNITFKMICSHMECCHRKSLFHFKFKQFIVQNFKIQNFFL